jgi:two-component system sensor histidine kinase RegB
MVTVALFLVVAQAVRPGLWGGHMLGGAWSPLGVVLLWALGNVALAARSKGSASSDETGMHLLLDVGLLTVLLALMGGAMNPFTMLYFLPMTLATLVSRRWTFLVAVSSVLGFGVLVLVFRKTMAGHDHGGHFGQHLLGMGLGLAVTGGLMTYFVHRIASALGAQQRELERLRRQAREDRYVASLGALSAGAAHELGTPLGTIGLLSGELAFMSDEERKEAVATISSELQRCKDILHGMRNPELSARALENRAPWPLVELVSAIETLRSSLAGTVLTIEASPELRATSSDVPRLPVEQIVRELVTNAARACAERSDGRGSISVAFSVETGELDIEVRDDGIGMSEGELDRAFEPFQTSRGTSRGLGLFLARMHSRQLGGRVELSSARGVGTVATLRIPLHERTSA